MATIYVDISAASGGNGTTPGLAFQTIQAALSAAGSGDTIEIATGTYTSALTFAGTDVTLSAATGATVTIDPTSGAALTFTNTTDPADGDAIVLDNINIAGATNGIAFASGAKIGTLTINGGTISGNSYAGIFTNEAQIAALNIIGTVFQGNGGGSNGNSNIKLYGFAGDALIQDVTIHGAASSSSSPIAQYGLDFVGEPNPPGTSPALGTVVIDGLTIDGYFSKNALAIFNYADIGGLTITDVDLSGAVTGWGPVLNIDGITGDIDASQFDITFPNTDVIHVELQGEKSGQAETDNTIIGTDTNDRIVGKGGDDTLSGGDGNDQLFGDEVTGATQVNTDGDDVLDGGAGDDALFGDTGADRLKGGAGADTLDGGGGIDTAVFDVAATTFSYDGSNWTVDDGGGIDTLSDVERIAVGNGADTETTWLVASDAELAQALANASAGDTIRLAAGEYTGNYSITTDGITLEGGDGVVFTGTFKSDNGIADGTHVDDWLHALLDGQGYTGAAGAALTVNADNVTIRGIDIGEYLTGIDLAGGDGITVDDVDITDVVNGIRKGTASVITGFSLIGGTISHGELGVVIYSGTSGGAFDDVNIDGTVFHDLNQKGLYFEELSNAVIVNITMTDVGQNGRSEPFGGTAFDYGNGIDINLKYGDYENIVISDFTFTDVGLSNGGGASGALGGAIVIKARDDGAYASDPATLDNVTVRDGTVNGDTLVVVRIGEPGKSNAGPTNVVIQNLTASDADLFADNQSDTTLKVVGTDGGDTITIAAGATAGTAVQGGEGDDTLTGSDGDDTLTGGAGDDTAVLDGDFADYALTFNEDGTVTIADERDPGTDGFDGTDTLSGIEFLTFADRDVNIVRPSDVALDDTAVNENVAAGAVVGLLSATDAAGETLSYQLLDDNALPFTVVGNQLRVDGALNFETKSSYDITVRVTDALGLSTDKTFTIDVDDLNETPTGLAISKDDINETAAVGTVVGTLSATDPDGDALTYSLISNAGNFFRIEGNKVVLNKALDFEALDEHSIGIRVSDGNGGTADKTFVIDVNDVNETPTGLAISKDDINETAAVGTVVGTLSATDPDGDALTYSLISNAGNFFRIEGNKVVLNKALDFETLDEHSIGIRVSDGNGGTADKTFVIDVNDVNEKPTGLALSNARISETAAVGTVLGVLSATDPDGDSLAYALTSNPGGFFRIDGNKIVLTKALDFETLSGLNLGVRVSDGNGGTADKAFAVNVNDVNEDPTGLALSNARISETAAVGTVLGVLSATDPDGDSLAYALTSNPGSFFRIDGNKIVLARALDFETLSSLNLGVRVSDGNGGTADKAFAVTVTDVNEDPTGLTLSKANIDEDAKVGTVVGILSAKDPDGDALTYSLLTNPGGFFRIEGNKLVLAKALDFEALSRINIGIRALDGHGGEDQAASLAIAVNDVNEKPTGPQLSKSTVSETAAVGTVVGLLSGSDPDGDKLAYALASNPGGFFKIDGNKLVLAKALDFETLSKIGIDIRVADGSGGVDSRSFTITVTDEKETFNGTGGNDRMTGTGNDDTMNGLGGNDTISALAGNDRISGGAGFDSLGGGGGKDVFVFETVGAIGNAAGRRDVVTDFSTADDRLDLSLIDANTRAGGDQAFKFIGSNAFGKVAGQLRFEVSGNTTLVTGDVDGDGKADFSIELSGKLKLDGSDFLF